MLTEALKQRMEFYWGDMKACELGRILKKARLEKGYTLEQLAAETFIPGRKKPVDRSYIASAESGRCTMSYRALDATAKVLGSSACAFLAAARWPRAEYRSKKATFPRGGTVYDLTQHAVKKFILEGSLSLNDDWEEILTSIAAINVMPWLNEQFDKKGADDEPETKRAADFLFKLIQINPHFTLSMVACFYKQRRLDAPDDSLRDQPNNSEVVLDDPPAALAEVLSYAIIINPTIVGDMLDIGLDWGTGWLFVTPIIMMAYEGISTNGVGIRDQVTEWSRNSRFEEASQVVEIIDTMLSSLRLNKD